MHPTTTHPLPSQTPTHFKSFKGGSDHWYLGTQTGPVFMEMCVCEEMELIWPLVSHLLSFIEPFNSGYISISKSLSSASPEPGLSCLIEQLVLPLPNCQFNFQAFSSGCFAHSLPPETSGPSPGHQSLLGWSRAG